MAETKEYRGFSIRIDSDGRCYAVTSDLTSYVDRSGNRVVLPLHGSVEHLYLSSPERAELAIDRLLGPEQAIPGDRRL